MAQVYNKLYVDVRRKVTDIITAVQNDANSRFLDVYLKDNGLPIDLTGHVVRLYGKKHDGTEVYTQGDITEAAKGRCQFKLTSQTLAVAQDLEVQIVIYYNSVQILQSLPFSIKVVKSLISANAIESSNEYGALVVLYQNLYEAYDLMVSMVKNIGVPGDIASRLTIDTMWKAWEYICNYVSEDLTDIIQNTFKNITVDVASVPIIKHIQRGYGQGPTNSTSATVTVALTGFTNADKMIAITGGYHTNTSFNDGVAVASLTTSELTLYTYGLNYYSYQVIEFY